MIVLITRHNYEYGLLIGTALPQIESIIDRQTDRQTHRQTDIQTAGSQLLETQL